MLVIYIRIISAFTLFWNAMCGATYTADYTWKEFHGHVPNDALRAGTDEYGAIYVGQVLFDGKLLPGKIYKYDNNIYFEDHGVAWATTQNIKILCTKQPENFEWIQTKHAEYNLIKNFDLIPGGYNLYFAMFIGRAETNKGTDVGKVLCNETNCLGLYTSKHGKSTKYLVYSVLAHNPK